MLLKPLHTFIHKDLITKPSFAIDNSFVQHVFEHSMFSSVTYRSGDNISGQIKGWNKNSCCCCSSNGHLHIHVAVTVIELKRYMYNNSRVFAKILCCNCATTYHK